MKYIEIKVETTTEGSEIIADILGEYSPLGVSVQDGGDVQNLIKDNKASWDYIDNDLLCSGAVIVKGYVEESEYALIADEIVNRINCLKKNAFCEFGSLKMETCTVDGDEWREKWKENFKPIYIKDLVVCPSWIEVNEPSNKVIKISSNMAFGTGEHQTTSMCLKLLQDFIKKDQVVLDVGCGSGILGIGSAKLGAKKVYMTDIDQTAVDSAKENAEINDVKNCEIICGDLLSNSTVKGDLILANIMADVLISFCDKISNNLNPNGIVVLSGILNTREADVENKYLQNGFEILSKLHDGEWCAIAVKMK